MDCGALLQSLPVGPVLEQADTMGSMIQDMCRLCASTFHNIQKPFRCFISDNNHPGKSGAERGSGVHPCGLPRVAPGPIMARIPRRRDLNADGGVSMRLVRGFDEVNTGDLAPTLNIAQTMRVPCARRQTTGD